MTIAIIDYGAGNLNSVAKALRHVGAEVTLATQGAQLASASHIVLPGVGAFAACMTGLNALPGMRDALEEAVLGNKKPFLGVCVGMQMLFDRSEEHGEHAGLGWIRGAVVRIAATEPDIHSPLAGESNPPSVAKEDLVRGQTTQHKAQSTFLPTESAATYGLASSAPPQGGSKSPLKIPHMGWNDLQLMQPEHPLLRGIAKGDHAYFVHSYHCVPQDPAVVLATVEYGRPLTAALASSNIMATQFHPEKSQQTGLRLLKNFLECGRDGN